MPRSTLAARVKALTTGTITRAELVDDEPPITIAQAAVIKQTLETVGIEFITESGSAAGVRLRRST